MSFEAHPTPSEEEAVAIAAALEALWPRPAQIPPPQAPRPLAWRFSGRWWQRDRLTQSGRPWR